jgi:DNA-binding NarL/FixJ family response regulator
MKYVKAETILPDKLLKEIQKYIQGEYVYIPSKPQSRKKWGENSGNRDYLRKRNETISYKYSNGLTINDLAEEFYLSIDSIKKIIYKKDQ